MVGAQLARHFHKRHLSEKVLNDLNKEAIILIIYFYKLDYQNCLPP
jgi:hypothetical protein